MFTENGEFRPASFADLQAMDDPNSRTRERRERRRAHRSRFMSSEQEAQVTATVAGVQGDRPFTTWEIAKLMGFENTQHLGVYFPGWSYTGKGYVRALG